MTDKIFVFRGADRKIEVSDSAFEKSRQRSRSEKMTDPFLAKASLINLNGQCPKENSLVA